MVRSEPGPRLRVPSSKMFSARFTIVAVFVTHLFFPIQCELRVGPKGGVAWCGFGEEKAKTRIPAQADRNVAGVSEQYEDHVRTPHI